ncbi:MAG: type II toxin-antitoxin system RelE/ParE family toxin [Bryobacteraceae bacterium]
MERVTAYRGQVFTIAFARLKSGQSPGAEFYDALSLEDKAKLDNLFRLLADHGRIANDEKSGVLDKGLFEFKSFQIRMPYAYASERGLILITHGFYKKKDKAPKEEIGRARRILKEDQE